MDEKRRVTRENHDGCAGRVGDDINLVNSTPHARDNAANQAGSFFIPLPKACSFEQQLEKMKRRGVIVSDEDAAIRRLRDLNYYRLRGYWLTLERDDVFLDNTSFDDIWDIYRLDQGLRRWLWQAIAPIEIKLRTSFAYEFARRCGPAAYLEPKFYHNHSLFERALENYERERDRAYRHGVAFVVHNMDRYGKLPVWAAVEVMSFGTLSMFYGNLDLAVGTDGHGLGLSESIASAFGTRQRYLKSWSHHLTTVRNIVAHHGRLYNRSMTIKPRLLRRDSAYASGKQFPTFLIVKRLYEQSWPEEWDRLGAELNECIEGCPEVDLDPMGFPPGWKRILNLR